ncbi:MAG TPA: GGDEF domain-containing protein [Longimicrobiales bacterium]|nr:GGDEF domain-containing protein [Longimicrobiales bacterium]
MRSNANPPARPPVELTDRARLGLAAVALGLLGVSLFTGGATSPFLLPLVPLLVVLVRHAARPPELIAPLVAALILSGFETLFGGGAMRGIIGGLVLAGATIPGWLWRREALAASTRLGELDRILAQARRGRVAEAPAAAQELADLTRSLGALAEQIGAQQVLLWDVEVYRGVARARAAARGRAGQTVRLPGDPLGWVWDQGIRMRLDPPPRWAEQGSLVVADRLRQTEEHGLLVTYGFDPAHLPVDDATFEQAAVYVRGLISVQEARSTAAAGRRRVERLLDGLKGMPADAGLETLAASLCETAVEITDATGAAIGVWAGEAGRIISASGTDGGPRPGDSFAPPASELALAIRANTMVVRDGGTWSLGKTSLANENERWMHRPRSMAALPLHSATGVNGVLAVWSARSLVLDPDGLELLPLLAPQIALHIEQARELDRMRETAARDPLTQLRNRRAFDEVFTAETVRFARYGRPLSLLVIDLDHFKSINDQFGHEAGDDVLCRTARIIEASIRDIDTAARFGGEEFVVLLPETDIASALDVAERIRATVAASDIDFRGRPVPVRASIGVSACPDRVALPADLVRSADAALYQAKAEGRNRVVAARG